MGTSGRLVVIGDVVYCIDTLATALYHRSTVEDAGVAGSGLCPAFATVWVPILIAANVALKKLKG